jgi:hypothetical protein
MLPVMVSLLFMLENQVIMLPPNIMLGVEGVEEPWRKVYIVLMNITQMMSCV